MLSKSRSDRYRRELEAVSKSAVRYVGSVLQATRAENPQMSIAELRETAIKHIEDSANIFGEQSAALATELLEEMADGAGVSVQTLIEDVIDHKHTDRYVRYHVAKAEEDYGSFEDRVTDLAKYHVYRAAQENMIKNCKRNKLRYARVPSGTETCGFCFMLASRGFVYRSEESAGSHSQFHMHCDCIVVPGFGDAHPDKQIAGYEPTKMAQRYKQCVDTIGGEKGIRDRWDRMGEKEKLIYKGRSDNERYQQFKTAEITKELNTRDWKWLYTGVEPEITFETEDLKKEIRKKRKHEEKTAERLKAHGIKCEFQIDRKEISKGVFKGLPDLKNGYEIKTLSECQSVSGLDRHIRKSIHKEGLIALVFDITEDEYLTDDEVIHLITHKCRKIDSKIYLLNGFEKLVRIQ